MQKVIDLDSIGKEFDLRVKLGGKEYRANEPSLDMIETMSKLDSVPEDQHIGIIRDFMKKSLPNASDKLINGVSIRQAKALIENFMEAIKEDPTDATEEN